MILNRLDPVAQSFVVEEPTYITKVDLFFQSKDSTIPVFLQIRKMENNNPSKDVLPFSATVIPAADVQISADASLATTVTFDSPIFVDTGEYALTLGSDSKSYNAYVSELNGTDTTSGRRISEQPLVGSLFLSENLKLFQPDLFQDLKVNIYRAKFYTNTTSTVNMELVGSGGLGSSITEALDVDPLEVYPGLSTMKVYHFNHGYADTSFVVLRNVGNANVQTAIDTFTVGNIIGMDGNVIQDVEFAVSNVTLDSYTVDLPNIAKVTKRTRFGGSYVRAEENTAYSSLTPQNSIFKPSNTTVTSKVLTTTLGTSYSVGSSFVDVQNAVQNDFESEQVIANSVNKTRKASGKKTFEYRVDMNSNDDKVSPVIDLEQLGVNFKRNLVNNPSYATVKNHELNVLSNVGDGNLGVGHKSNIIQLSNNIGTITLSNPTDQDNANALLVGTILNVNANTNITTGAGANNTGLYRILDISTSSLENTTIKVAKIVGNIDTDTANNNVYHIVSTNDFVAEEAAVGGSAFSKYISRQVDFINPSTGIKFFFDVSKPAESTIEIYFKTKLAGDSTNMNSIEYQKVSDVTITNSLGGEFIQFQKEVTNINEFNSLVFKIVLNSSDNNKIPKIKNLRVIATG